MGMDPVTAGLITAGAGMGMDYLGQKSAQKGAKQANEAMRQDAERRRADIEKYGREALAALSPGYEAAYGLYGQLQDRIPGQITRTMVPRMDIAQQASLMGQGTSLAGLEQAMNAYMGRDVDLSGLRPQGFDIDFQQLAQSTQMQPLDFSGLSKLSGLGGRANIQNQPSQDQIDMLRNIQMMNYGMRGY